MAIDRVARAEALMERVREDADLRAVIQAAPDAAALEDVLAAAGYGDVEPDDVFLAARVPRARDESDRLTDGQLEQVVGGAGTPNQMSPAAASHLMQLILIGLVPGDGGS
ncbi:MAG TPA: Nif11-like leader peptide family natural product precursor [Chloroflexota bacterium]|jgi:hypothetical protein